MTFPKIPENVSFQDYVQFVKLFQASSFILKGTCLDNSAELVHLELWRNSSLQSPRHLHIANTQIMYIFCASPDVQKHTNTDSEDRPEKWSHKDLCFLNNDYCFLIRVTTTYRYRHSLVTIPQQGSELRNWTKYDLNSISVTNQLINYIIRNT
jgi:hypothetical protein